MRAARRVKLIGRGLLLVLLLGLAQPSHGWAGLAVGKAQNEAVLNGVSVTFYSYKPGAAASGPLIVAFHGSDRQSEKVRDFLVPLADRFQAIVVAPLMDEARFPRWRYQWAGVVEPLPDDATTADVRPKRRYRLRDEAQWTGRLVLALVDHVRRAEGRPDMPFYLIGHSAGAQLIGRLSAFTLHDAQRIVLANPGSYLAPTRRRRFPYGFGGLPASLSSDADLRRYLALPITIYVGTDDRRRSALDKSPGAERQGANRYERGQRMFELARDTAARKGWPFGWRLVEAPGVGHNSREMYGAPTAVDALFGASPPSGQPQILQ